MAASVEALSNHVDQNESSFTNDESMSNHLDQNESSLTNDDSVSNHLDQNESSLTNDDSVSNHLDQNESSLTKDESVNIKLELDGKEVDDETACSTLNSALLTDEILEEERMMEEKTMEDQKQLKQRMLEERKQMEEEKCYKRLNLLLDRSGIYAKFMAEKLERSERQLQKKVARERTKGNKKENDSAAINIQANTRHGVKRKLPDTDIDTIDKEFESPSKKKGMNSIKELEKVKQTTIIDAFKQVNAEDSHKSSQESAVLGEPPKLLTGGTMYPYQMEGYEWLKALYENGVNGILADEMGLGKTIQCIAFIAYLIENGIDGPFFVCAPLSTLPNWYAEIKRFTPDIPVILYHGPKDERHAMIRQFMVRKKSNDVRSCPIVLTSYQVALFDARKLCRIRWRMLVIDEAHRIKNFECKLVVELKTYWAEHRLLLTGTPLQNNLAELWSLLNFILPEIFDDLQVFQSWFDIATLTQKGATQEIVAKEQEKQIVSTIHQILAPFLLRRIKADVNLGLPPKKEVIVHAPLSKLQVKYYTGAVNKTIRSFFEEKVDETQELKKRVSKKTRYFGCDDGFEDLSNLQPASSKSDNPEAEESEIYIKLDNVVMCLRKICNHPYHISYPLDYCGEYRVDEDMVLASGKLRVLDILLAGLKGRGHKILLFSQLVSTLQILGDYCVFRGYRYCTLNGTMLLPERQEQLEDFKNDPDMFIFLISTKAGGLGLNIVAADTVIFYDSDWNPQGDIQAQDRCHRIGQHKPVVIYRLVVPGTVDERVIDVATAKRKLEKVIMKKGRFNSKHSANRSYGSLSREELLELLESSDISSLVKADDECVLSNEELEKLLDRSDML